MQVKATLNLWALAQIKGRQADAKGPVGQLVVHGNGGQTTAIAAVVCKERHIIRTVNGSLYGLGTPNLMFVVRHPEIMRELGF